MLSQAERLLDMLRRGGARRERKCASGNASGAVAGALLLFALCVVLLGLHDTGGSVGLEDLVAVASPVHAAGVPARQAPDVSGQVPPHESLVSRDGAGGVQPYAGNYRIPILMYHDVGDPAGGLTVTPEMLEEQLDVLAAHGYEAVSMDTLLLALRGEPVHLPEKGVVITFDDAYSGVFRKAYPILKKRGLTATLYVVTGLVEKKGYVNWEQIREMESDGWTIGSHTVHHLDLRLLTGKDLQDEIASARSMLQQNTGQPILSFSYPSGKYDPAVVHAVESAGHYGAVTTDPGTAMLLDAPFTLKRVRVDGRDAIAVFKAKLSIP